MRLTKPPSKRPKAPKEADWDAAMRDWQKLQSDEGAHFDKEVRLDASKLPPLVTWGTSPEMVVPVSERIPDPAREPDKAKREGMERALAYCVVVVEADEIDRLVAADISAACASHAIQIAFGQ